MNCSTPGFPIHHQLLEPAQTHVCWVSDASQPSHPVVPCSSHLHSFPASRSLSMSWLFASGYQCIGDSASASVLPMNTQDWFPSGSTGLISLQSKGLLRFFSNTTVGKHQFFSTQLSLWCNYHIHTWLLEKPWLWVYGPLLAKWYVCFLMLSRFLTAFLLRKTRLFIPCLQSPSSVILEPKKIKSAIISIFSPLLAMQWWYWMPWS